MGLVSMVYIDPRQSFGIISLLFFGLLQWLHLGNDVNNDNNIPPPEHGHDYINTLDSDDETYDDPTNPNHGQYF